MRTIQSFTRSFTRSFTPPFYLLAVVVMLLLAGCSVGSVFPNLEPALGLTTPAPTAETADNDATDRTPAPNAPSITEADRGSAPTAASNRLVIVRNDGNIFTINPDGSAPFAMTIDASRSLQYSQPTWSPDGESIVWTQINLRGDQMQSAIITSRFDGSNVVHGDVPFPPFYYFWSPDSAKLAYLNNWSAENNQAGMALRLLDVAGGAGETTTLAKGQPFYLSWSPDSNRMITHVGNERIALLSTAGEELLLSSASTNFPTPQWSSDGNYLIYAIFNGNQQQLVVTDQQGQLQRKVTTYKGNVNFTLSPTTNQLAYIITEDARGTSAFGPLYVVDIDSERTVEVSADPVFAFFWSPDGTKLAFMQAERGGSGAVRLRWQVWDGAAVDSYDLVLPSRMFLQRYLPFFDQYAQSMTIWSPDSSAFTYVGTNADGVNGVWVQALGADEPTLVSDGVFAAWSPK